jgi:hypothetical protein
VLVWQEQVMEVAAAVQQQLETFPGRLEVPVRQVLLLFTNIVNATFISFLFLMIEVFPVF